MQGLPRKSSTKKIGALVVRRHCHFRSSNSWGGNEAPLVATPRIVGPADATTAIGSSRSSLIEAFSQRADVEHFGFHPVFVE